MKRTPPAPRARIETANFGAAHRLAKELTAAGLNVVGCSLCSRLRLKKGRKPAPCPVCGNVVTRRR